MRRSRLRASQASALGIRSSSLRPVAMKLLTVALSALAAVAAGEHSQAQLSKNTEGSVRLPASTRAQTLELFAGCSLAVVRVFSTEEEVQLLMDSGSMWDTTMPCASKSNTSTIDLILVYSKDLAADPKPRKRWMLMVRHSLETRLDKLLLRHQEHVGHAEPRARRVRQPWLHHEQALGLWSQCGLLEDHDGHA